MGANNFLHEALAKIEQDLHFRVLSNSEELLSVIDRAGQKRFELAIQAVVLWQRPHHDGRQKYDRLMKLLTTMTPASTGKPRNASVAHARELSDDLDTELSLRLEREE